MSEVTKEQLPDRKMALAERLWVMPDAATRLFDLEYQAVAYEGYHQHQLGQWGHLLTMTPINWCFFYLFSLIPLTWLGVPEGASLLAAIP